MKNLNKGKSCGTNGSRGSTAILKVCTHNGGTLRTEDNLARLIDEVDQIKLDVIGLCETYRKGEGSSEIKGGY